MRFSEPGFIHSLSMDLLSCGQGSGVSCEPDRPWPCPHRVGIYCLSMKAQSIPSESQGLSCHRSNLAFSLIYLSSPSLTLSPCRTGFLSDFSSPWEVLLLCVHMSPSCSLFLPLCQPLPGPSAPHGGEKNPPTTKPLTLKSSLSSFIAFSTFYLVNLVILVICIHVLSPPLDR